MLLHTPLTRTVLSEESESKDQNKMEVEEDLAENFAGAKEVQ